MAVAATFAEIIYKNKVDTQLNNYKDHLETLVHKRTSQLQKSNKELQTLDKLKNDFIAVASHELRTPMTLIRGYSSMIIEDYENDVSEDVM